MTENEWEPGRYPRPRPGGLSAGWSMRPDPLAEYVALEVPRESVAWLLRAGGRSGEARVGPAPRRAWVRPARSDFP